MKKVILNPRLQWNELKREEEITSNERNLGFNTNINPNIKQLGSSLFWWAIFETLVLEICNTCVIHKMQKRIDLNWNMQQTFHFIIFYSERIIKINRIVNRIKDYLIDKEIATLPIR